MPKKKGKTYEEQLKELQTQITSVNRQINEMRWLISNYNNVQSFTPDMPSIDEIGHVADRLRVEAIRLEAEYKRVEAEHNLGSKAKKALAIYRKLAAKLKAKK